MGRTRSNEPLDRELYARVKKAVYKKYPVHSAYRSGRLVHEYLKRGGRYKGRRRSGTLARWFRERWTNQRGEIGYRKKGDVYRPSVRVSRDTPATWGELTPKQVKHAQREKKRTGHVQRFRSPARPGDAMSCARVPLHHRKGHRVPGAPGTCTRKDGKVMQLPRKYSRQQCRATGRQGFTQRASCAAYLKGGKQSALARNVEGTTLQLCNADLSKEATGFQRTNQCSAAAGDQGQHHVCLTDIAAPIVGDQNFCALTDQPDWCTAGRKGNWCVCQHAIRQAMARVLADASPDERDKERRKKKLLSRIQRRSTHEDAQATLRDLETL